LTQSRRGTVNLKRTLLHLSGLSAILCAFMLVLLVSHGLPDIESRSVNFVLNQTSNAKSLLYSGVMHPKTNFSGEVVIRQSGMLDAYEVFLMSSEDILSWNDSDGPPNSFIMESDCSSSYHGLNEQFSCSIYDVPINISSRYYFLIYYLGDSPAGRQLEQTFDSSFDANTNRLGLISAIAGIASLSSLLISVTIGERQKHLQT
jgi:hypothetical protein